MMRTLEVQLLIRDQSGCPFGTNMEKLSATQEGGIWSVQRPIPQENEKKGKGASRKQAVIDWFVQNMEG